MRATFTNKNMFAGSALLLGSTLLLACSGAGTVSPTAIDVRQVASNLTGPFDGSVVKIVKGNYVGCTGHTTTEEWDVAANGEPETSLLNKLSVVFNDNSCEIAITKMVFENQLTFVRTTLENGLGLSVQGNYRDIPSAFGDNVSDDPDMYVNARKDIAGFSNNFTMFIRYSEDVAQVSATKIATYAKVTPTSFDIGSIKAPDYTPPVGLPGLTIMVDALGNVIDVGGSINFNLGLSGNEGEEYVVVNDDFIGSPGVLNDVKNTFLAFGPSNVIAGPPYSTFLVNGLNLGLDGVNISGPGVDRYIIVKHHDTATTIDTYLVITLHFEI